MISPPRIDGQYRETILVSLLSCILYWATSSPNLTEAHDSITYINDIDSGNLFHAHHLLYNWLAAGWVGWLRIIGYSGDSALPVQLLNGLFGGLTVGLVHALLRGATRLGRGWLFWGTTLVACSYGLWFYSTAVEVYIIPLFFLMLAFIVLVHGSDTPRTYLWIGALQGMAILFHQINVLFSAVIIAALIIRRGDSPILPRLGAYAATMVPVVVVPYVCVAMFHYRFESFGGFVGWLLEYAISPNHWEAPALSSLPRIGIGFGRALVGGHFLFALPEFASWAQQLLVNNWLSDEVFLVRRLGPTAAYTLVALSMGLLVMVSVFFTWSIRSWRAVTPANRILLRLLFVWIVAYSLFFSVWEPTNLEFWIPQVTVGWMMLLILWGTGARPSPRPSRAWILPAMAVALVVVNYMGSILWLSQRSNDYYYVRAEQLAAHSGGGDLIIVDHWWILEGHIRRHTPAEVLALTAVYESSLDVDKAAAEIHRSIETTLESGGSVLVSRWAIDLDPLVVRRDGAAIVSLVDQVWPRYRTEWREVGEGPGRFYVLSPGAYAPVEDHVLDIYGGSSGPVKESKTSRLRPASSQASEKFAVLPPL